MKTITALLAASTLLASSLLAAPAIVANADVKTAALSKEDAKNVLLGTKGRWDDGTPIRLAVLRGIPGHEAAVQAFTSRTADQFDKYWKKQVFSGKGIAPDAFDTEEELCAFVAKTPGAVGYVGDEAAASKGVKVIAVN